MASHGEIHGEPERGTDGQFLASPRADNVRSGSPGPLFDNVKPKKKARSDKSAGKVAGNSPDYALKRLKRDNPALAAKVVAGEMSAHRAAVEAGFRRRILTIDAVDAERIKAQMIKRLGKDLAREVAALILQA